MIRLRQPSLCILLILLLWNLLTAQKSKSAMPSEQMSFGYEIKVKRPVKLPRQILKLLKNDVDVREVCSAQSVTQDHIESDSFVTSHINLNVEGSASLIVTSADNGSCYLGGANTGPFWIFYLTRTGYRLGLKERTHDLDVLRTKTRGFNDIRSMRPLGPHVVVTIFKFDGNQYKVWRSWKHPIRV